MVADGSMPQDADPLTAEEIASIEHWINTGATLDAGMGEQSPLIAIMPKLPQPAPPDAYRVPVPITAVAFSVDGSQVATSGYHEVLVWNTADATLGRRITNVAERVYDIAYSPDGSLIAVAAGTPAQVGELKLFRAADGALLADLIRTDDSVFAVAFSPDGTRVASGGADRSIRVFDVASGKEQLFIEDHADWVLDIAWTPDGAKLASASRDKTSKVFDATTGESLVTFNGHGEPLIGVTISPDGTQAITGGRDKQARVWTIADGKEVRAIGGFGDEVFRVRVTADSHLFSCSADKTAREHNLADGAVLRTFSGHADWVYSLDVHAASKRLVTGSYNGEVRIWNLEDGAALQAFVAAPGHQNVEATAAVGR
jgi:WD40 repeat protein